MRKTLLVWMAALSALSCRTSTDVVVHDPAPGAARLRAGASLESEVDRLVVPLIADGEDEGMIVGVMHPDGRVQTFRYGQACGPGTPPPAGDTLFQVGSLTKTFVAALMEVLFQEGFLKPEDTVRDILPMSVELSADAGALTMYELATHSSGLPREHTCAAAFLSVVDYMFTGRNPYAYVTRDSVYAYLRTVRLPPKSGRVVEYSNLATGLMAHLIEVRTGRTIADLLAEKVTGPLQMTDTVFFLNADQQRRLAVGHVGEHPCLFPREAALSPWDMGDFMRGTGGLYSTLDDLMILARLNLGLSSHALSPLLCDMQRPLTHAPGEACALGWIIHSFDEDRLHITYKYGIVSGYSAYLGMNVEKRLAVVVLSNSFHWDEKTGHNVLLRLSGAMEAAPAEIAATQK